MQELFTDKSKWTQKTLARTEEGGGTCTSFSDAVCWCVVGAAEKCYPNYSDFTSVIDKMFVYIQHHWPVKENRWYSPTMRIYDTNDNMMTFRDVKRMVKKLNI